MAGVEGASITNGPPLLSPYGGHSGLTELRDPYDVRRRTPYGVRLVLIEGHPVIVCVGSSWGPCISDKPYGNHSLVGIMVAIRSRPTMALIWIPYEFQSCIHIYIWAPQKSYKGIHKELMHTAVQTIDVLVCVKSDHDEVHLRPVSCAQCFLPKLKHAAIWHRTV